MSARQRPAVFMLALSVSILGVSDRGYAQCNPQEPNTKCWDNQSGDGTWNRDINWDPDGVPEATDNVCHSIPGTITYDVTEALNQTIASFTAGETATGLKINAGLVLHLTGKMENEGTGDYELTLKSRADMTVAGEVRFVNVTLENGITGDETTVDITGNVIKGDWWVPKDTRVTVTGDVDATGRTWHVGSGPPTPTVRGGSVVISGDTIAGTWETWAEGIETPLPEIKVGGTIVDGCWRVLAETCASGSGPKLRWTFNHVIVDTGADACQYLQQGPLVNLRFTREVELAPEIKPGYDGAVIVGGRWVFDGVFPKAKIAEVNGGVWNQIHHTESMTLGGVDYALDIGNLNPAAAGDCSLTSEDCSVVMDTDLFISGPGNSYIPSLKAKHGGGGSCTGEPGTDSLETAKDGTHTDTLTFDTLLMQPNTESRGHLNRNSSGATETNIVIQESATVISSDVNARSFVVDNPDPLDIAVLELHSPNKSPSRINLAGPAEFGGTGRCELVYHNQDNRFFSRAATVGSTLVGGFTLHDRAVIHRADS